MKRLLYLTLVLLAVLLTGCMVANGDEPLLLSTNAAAMTTEAPVTEPPTTAAPTTEPPVNLEGVEMVLYASSAVTPDQPAARLVVSIPQAELPGAADRLASLTLTLDGEEAGSWPELELEPGLEVETELTFSFERYQPDRTAAVVFTLSRGEDTLVCETAVELRNDPDEVYAQRSGDPRPYQIDVVRNHNVVIIYGKDEDGAGCGDDGMSLVLVYTRKNSMLYFFSIHSNALSPAKGFITKHSFNAYSESRSHKYYTLPLHY